jgi:capsular polysaccharide biosynthesis protein
VSIVAGSRSPQLAAGLANAFARQYVAFREREARASIDRAVATAKQQLASLGAAAASPQGHALQGRLQQLQTNGALISGGVDVVAVASIPASPASPNTPVLLALGLVLGFGLATAIALAVERSDRRLKDESAVEQAFERPVLGVIPRARSTGPALAAIHPTAFGLLIDGCFDRR